MTVYYLDKHAKIRLATESTWQIPAGKRHRLLMWVPKEQWEMMSKYALADCPMTYKKDGTAYLSLFAFNRHHVNDPKTHVEWRADAKDDAFWRDITCPT